MNSNQYLCRTDDDVVDWNEDQLHEEADESHHYESDRCTEGHFREFCTEKP